MKTVIISGNMGTGKTYFCQKMMQKKYHPAFRFPFFVLEMDHLGHFLWEQKNVQRKISRVFRKKMTRKTMRKELQKYPQKLEMLEKILHPLIQKMAENMRKKNLKKKGTLLFPCAIPHKFFHADLPKIHLETPWYVQFRRLKKRGLSIRTMAFFLRRQKILEEGIPKI